MTNALLLLQEISLCLEKLYVELSQKKERGKKRCLCEHALCLSGGEMKKPHFSKCCFTFKSKAFANAAQQLMYVDDAS